MNPITSAPRNGTRSLAAPSKDGGKKKSKKRVRNFTPDDRAAHRFFEKSRREAFNGRLLELAGLLPVLEDPRRLSKHIIVDESIAYHKRQRSKCLLARREIHALLAERDELLAEVNAFRVLHKSAAGSSIREPRPVDPTLLEMLEDENRQAADNGPSEEQACSLRPRNDEITTGLAGCEAPLQALPQETAIPAAPIEAPMASQVDGNLFPIQGSLELSTAPKPPYENLTNVPLGGNLVTTGSIINSGAINAPHVPFDPEPYAPAPGISTSCSEWGATGFVTNASPPWEQDFGPLYNFSPKDLNQFAFIADGCENHLLPPDGHFRTPNNSLIQ